MEPLPFFRKIKDSGDGKRRQGQITLEIDRVACFPLWELNSTHQQNILSSILMDGKIPLFITIFYAINHGKCCDESLV